MIFNHAAGVQFSLGALSLNKMIIPIEFVNLNSQNLKLRNIRELVSFWNSTKKELQKRIEHFDSIKHNACDKAIFAELAFCIFTPQSKAVSCWNAVKILDKKNLLYKGSAKEIANNITGVRFHNNKSKYLVEARNLFTIDKSIKIKNKLESFKEKTELRKWLVDNIKGVGYKEAGHFLRNIGMSGDLAILDRHILKNLYYFKAIKEIPETITEKKYIEIEKQMNEFCKKIKIPALHMDLLLWSLQTGGIFK